MKLAPVFLGSLARRRAATLFSFIAIVLGAIMTGTTPKPVARCRSMSSRVASASNFRRVTMVHAIIAEKTSWKKPQA